MISEQLNLSRQQQYQPLATRMRPRILAEVIGQQHLLQPNRPFYQAVACKKLHSMILWGPPGTGKTTLAEILARSVDAHFETLSAVLAGVKEIRAVIQQAQHSGRVLVLFVDEVHRFNKAQQDAFLPHVESGDIIFIGATTENPAFQLNNALLSRVRVYVLKPLLVNDILQVLRRALHHEVYGLGGAIHLTDELLLQIAVAADGDARQALNLLEIAADFSLDGCITTDILGEVLNTGTRRFDRQGDFFYDQISALHKAVRGSDPDAALYWLARLLDGGCDPHYLARRVLRMASEDIGNADPRALTLALEAWQIFERLGSPEGELAIAQAVVYCACAAKSNAVYVAFSKARQDVKCHGSLEVPLYLRNAPTRLQKELGHSDGYRYAHDEPDAFAKGVCYFPPELAAQRYYEPVERGLEIKIKQKLEYFRELNQRHQKE